MKALATDRATSRVVSPPRGGVRAGRDDGVPAGRGPVPVGDPAAGGEGLAEVQLELDAQVQVQGVRHHAGRRDALRAEGDGPVERGEHAGGEHDGVFDVSLV